MKIMIVAFNKYSHIAGFVVDGVIITKVPDVGTDFKTIDEARLTCERLNKIDKQFTYKIVMWNIQS